MLELWVIVSDQKPININNKINFVPYLKIGLKNISNKLYGQNISQKGGKNWKNLNFLLK